MLVSSIQLACKHRLQQAGGFGGGECTAAQDGDLALQHFRQVIDAELFAILRKPYEVIGMEQTIGLPIRTDRVIEILQSRREQTIHLAATEHGGV